MFSMAGRQCGYLSDSAQEIWKSGKMCWGTVEHFVKKNCQLGIALSLQSLPGQRMHVSCRTERVLEEKESCWIDHFHMRLPRGVTASTDCTVTGESLMEKNQPIKEQIEPKGPSCHLPVGLRLRCQFFLNTSLWFLLNHFKAKSLKSRSTTGPSCICSFNHLFTQ